VWKNLYNIKRNTSIVQCNDIFSFSTFQTFNNCHPKAIHPGVFCSNVHTKSYSTHLRVFQVNNFGFVNMTSPDLSLRVAV
jgi:hypothetical protein